MHGGVIYMTSSLNIEIYFMIPEHMDVIAYQSILLTMVFYSFLCNNNNTVIIKFFKNDFYSEYNINHTSICK